MDGPCHYCLDMRVVSKDGGLLDRIKVETTHQEYLSKDEHVLSNSKQKTCQHQSRIQCDKLVPVDDKSDQPENLPSNLRSLCIGATPPAQDEERLHSTGGINTPTNEHHFSSSSTTDSSSKQSIALLAHQQRIKLKVTLDPILASCLAAELIRSPAYLDLFTRNLVNHCSSSVETRKKTKCVIKIKLVVCLMESSLFSMEPDISWSKRMLPMWLLRISMDDAFSWLSTLGGAFSALGDESLQFAEKAGQVSVRQMKLALQLGDPILQARCMVYLAQSLFQKGYFRLAVCIVRKQYQFALSLGEHTDQRLINMCRGVWSILQYWQERRREHRKQCKGLHHQYRTSKQHPSNTR